MLITDSTQLRVGSLWAGVVTCYCQLSDGSFGRAGLSGVWMVKRPSRLRSRTSPVWTHLNTGREVMQLEECMDWFSVVRLPEPKFLRPLAWMERWGLCLTAHLSLVVRLYYHIRPSAWRRAVGIAEMVRLDAPTGETRASKAEVHGGVAAW